MKKTVLFITLLFFALGNIHAQSPTTFWKNNADVQWFNNQETTFILSSASELAGLSELVANGNSLAGITITIDADIDLGAHLWRPIGVDENLVFSGTFNGNNHVISNLFVEQPGQNYAGLFGRCFNASLLNISIENTIVRGEDSVGSLVGNAWQGVIIENCHATGVVVEATGDNVGGLVGDLVEGSTLYQCSSEGDVTGGTQVGGLLGSPYDGNSIVECFSEGTVHAVYSAGGLIGASVVGFPGTTETVINNCYSRANVVVDSGYGGGFSGNFAALLMVKNSYSTGDVTGPSFDGGFTGGAGAVITENTYWDEESSQHSNAVGGWTGGTPGTPDITSKTTAEMKVAAMADALNDGVGPWTIDPMINDGYPSFIPGSVSLHSEELTSVALKVYPNVFDSEIQIESDAQLKSYTVYETSGKVIQEGELNGNHAKITMQTVNSGMYMLLVKTYQGVISKKIVKK